MTHEVCLRAFNKQVDELSSQLMNGVDSKVAPVSPSSDGKYPEENGFQFCNGYNNSLG